MGVDDAGVEPAEFVDETLELAKLPPARWSGIDGNGLPAAPPGPATGVRETGATIADPRGPVRLRARTGVGGVIVVNKGSTNCSEPLAPPLEVNSVAAFSCTVRGEDVAEEEADADGDEEIDAEEDDVVAADADAVVGAAVVDDVGVDVDAAAADVKLEVGAPEVELAQV